MLFQYLKCLIAAVVICSLSACVYGPKTEKKSPLNALNGENYESAPGAAQDRLVIPMIKRKERLTRIGGHAEMRSGFIGVPVKQLNLGLYSTNGQLILEASTDLQGNFVFSGVIKNGSYVIKSNSPRYSASETLELKEYDIENLPITVTANSERDK